MRQQQLYKINLFCNLVDSYKKINGKTVSTTKELNVQSRNVMSREYSKNPSKIPSSNVKRSSLVQFPLLYKMPK